MALLIGFLGCLGGAVLLSWWLSNRRRFQMRALSMRLGWSFRYGAAARVEAAVEQFTSVAPHLSPQAMNTLTGWLRVGARRLPAVMGDHSIDQDPRGVGQSRGKKQVFSYLAVQLPLTQTPELLIQKEGLSDIVPQLHGPELVKMESEAFNRKVLVRCSQRKFAFDVIHPRMMEFLMDDGAPTVEIRGGWMRVTNGTHLWRPAEFIGWVSWSERFLAMWPEYLWEDRHAS
jgi:hypothetical protein